MELFTHRSEEVGEGGGKKLGAWRWHPLEACGRAQGKGTPRVQGSWEEVQGNRTGSGCPLPLSFYFLWEVETCCILPMSPKKNN